METAETTRITVGSPVGYSDDTWQIGSVRPPKVCLCCGLEFDQSERSIRGPYTNGPYRYVCSPCWRRPFLFFPDKKLAKCGECWIPQDSYRHRHTRATARRGARVSRVQEELRKKALLRKTRDRGSRRETFPGRGSSPRGKKPS